MAIWFLFIVTIIGIAFAVTIYSYDNSQFSKITGYSYFKLWTNKKIRFTYKLVKALSQAKGEHKILLNVKVPVSEHRSRNVDAIFLHQSGIYVIDTLHKDGWIYGREQDADWAQALHKEQLHKFDNPVTENKRLIFTLRDLLPDIAATYFHSLIIFSDSCSFRKIELHSDNVDVIKINDLKKYWSNTLDERLSKEEIDIIYQTLEKLTAFYQQKKQAQMKNITAN